MYAKFSKCEFWLEQVAFLVHVVSKDGIQVDPKKIEVVADWPRPTTVIEIRSFFGFSRLLQEICKRFLQDCSAFNKANSEKYQFFLDRQMRRTLLVA